MTCWFSAEQLLGNRVFTQCYSSVSSKEKSVCLKSICNYHTVQHISIAIATVLSLCSDNSILLVLCFSYSDSAKGTQMPGSPDAKIQHHFTTNKGINTTDLWHVQCILLD